MICFHYALYCYYINLLTQHMYHSDTFTHFTFILTQIHTHRYTYGKLLTYIYTFINIFFNTKELLFYFIWKNQPTNNNMIDKLQIFQFFLPTIFICFYCIFSLALLYKEFIFIVSFYIFFYIFLFLYIFFKRGFLLVCKVPRNLTAKKSMK